MSAAIGELTPIVGVKAACEALNVARASFYRKRGWGVFPAAAAVRFIPRALDSTERNAVLACLHEERFQNCAPAAVYATLLDHWLGCDSKTVLAGTFEHLDQLKG